VHLFLAKWFPLLALAMHLLNYIIIRKRCRVAEIDRPELAAGNRQILAGYFIGLGLPFVIMAAGILCGSTPHVFRYFGPPNGNPFVLGFFVSIALFYAVVLNWVFLRNGAQILVDHQRSLNQQWRIASQVKLFAGGLILVGSIAIGLMCSGALVSLDELSIGASE